VLSNECLESSSDTMTQRPPQELVEQIGIINNLVSSLSDLVDLNKIKMQHYGQEFQKPLIEIREDGMSLRSKLEVFKNQMEYALKAQYATNNSSRFASSDKVVDLFLSKTDEV
jgi:hypothetical protein